MKIIKQFLVAVVIATILTVTVAIPAAAATTAPGTLYYIPAYITVSLSGTFNMGYVLTNTPYYSNPLGVTTPPSSTVQDSECSYTLTRTNNVNIDLYCNIPDFSGGSDNMTNGNTGSNGATSFGAYSWYSGMTYSGKVVAKSSGSNVLYSNLGTGTGTTLKAGVEIKTQTNEWSGVTTSGSNAIFSVAIH